MKNIYWKKNIRYISILLSLWFIVSFGCGILFVEHLNTIQIGGFKLGFWFAQQPGLDEVLELDALVTREGLYTQN